MPNVYSLIQKNTTNLKAGLRKVVVLMLLVLLPRLVSAQIDSLYTWSGPSSFDVASEVLTSQMYNVTGLRVAASATAYVHDHSHYDLGQSGTNFTIDLFN